MSKYLVVVESPTKAKTIGKFLGKNYKVMSSMGHVRDLPKSKLGIDVEDDFKPHYITIRGKGDLLKELKKVAKNCEKVYYAADPDREGEAIAWHLKQYLEGNNDLIDPNPDELCRIEFNEITKESIKKAVKNPRTIDMDRFYAQQSRRILDRLVGYQISPLLWRKVKKGLSAGRVQSVAVRLICERQQEIDAFVPEEYWSLEADFLLNGGEITAKLAKIKAKKAEIANEEQMKKILSSLEGVDYVITAVQKKKKVKTPPAAFTTSALQQEANQKLNFTAKRTMQIAQQLYEGISLKGSHVGLITYMRTDSTRIAAPAAEEARAYIEETYGSEYCPKKARKYVVAATAQNAHEAIRPTSTLRTPASIKEYLSQPQYRLYKLIWERFIASQMADAIVENTTIDIKGGDCLFKATGNTVVFPGYMKLYKSENKNDLLPAAAKGDVPVLRKFDPQQHFTSPPPAFTEATLIKTLEKLGIGRPSTYVSIIETIVSRGYVSRKEKTFHPTELGILVNGLLMEHFPDILNVEFTARMEESLDKVEEGEMDWHTVLKDFYGPFSSSLAKAEESIGDVELVDEVSDVICEKCGANMVYKIGRYGKFLACPNYPKCRNIKSIDKDGKVEETTLEESEITCEKCGRKMVVKKGRYGKFLACPGYPECKNVKSIDEEIGVACTECGGAIVKKRNKRGRVFYGCKNYPECQTAYWNLPVEEVCPDCGRHLVEKIDRAGTKSIVCENKECPSHKKAKKPGRKKKEKS